MEKWFKAQHYSKVGRLDDIFASCPSFCHGDTEKKFFSSVSLCLRGKFLLSGKLTHCQTLPQKPEKLLRAAGSGFTDYASRVNTHSFPEDIAGLYAYPS